MVVELALSWPLDAIPVIEDAGFSSFRHVRKSALVPTLLPTSCGDNASPEMLPNVDDGAPCKATGPDENVKSLDGESCVLVCRPDNLRRAFRHNSLGDVVVPKSGCSDGGLVLVLCLVVSESVA